MTAIAADPRIARSRTMSILRSRSALACLVIFAVVAAWFSPWWAGGRVLAPLDLKNLMMSPWRGDNDSEFAKNHFVADGVDQYLIYRIVAAESYANEGWLGWCSLTYGGTAQYANTMALYFDWSMQLHRWFDFWTAWHLGLMGQVSLAAIGMFLFLRGRNINQLWACCGGLAYAANSQFVTWIYHRWALGSFCWVPWILWAIDGYRNGKRGFWAAVPVFIAMAFLGGTLQHCALVILVAAAIWFEEAISLPRSKSKIAGTPSHLRGKSGKDAGDGCNQPLRCQLRLLGRYAAWGLLGAGLAGMMIIPCTDAFLTSNSMGLHRGMNVNLENSVYPEGILQPLLNLAAYPLQVFPWILGRCDSIDVLKLFKSSLFYVCFAGFIPTLTAFLGMFGRRTPLLARLLCVAGLLLPLTPLVRPLYQRLYLLFLVGGVLAFAHFMQHAERELKLRLFRAISIAGGTLVACWTVFSIALHFMPETRMEMHGLIADRAADSTFGYFTSWIHTRTDRFIADLFIWSPRQLLPLSLALAGLAGLYWSASQAIDLKRLGGLLVAVAVICEVTLFAERWVVWSDPAEHPMFPETPESAALVAEVGQHGRVTTLIHPTAHMAMTPFVLNTASAYGVASISGYDSIVPDGMIRPNESPGDATRLGRLAVTHLITWTGNGEVPMDWRQTWRSPVMTIYENPLAFPRYAGFTDTGALNGFFAGRDVSARPLLESTGMRNSRLIDVPDGIEWIRIAENHANGWKYRHEEDKFGKWRPVERAPDASMTIPMGGSRRDNRVEMRYDPPMRRYGFGVSLTSLFFLFSGQLIAIRFKHGC